MARYKTKTFEQQTVFRRPAGAAPDVWEQIAQTPKIDDVINAWLNESSVTGRNLVSTSPPGIYSHWLDKDMTIRVVMLAVIVIYEET